MINTFKLKCLFSKRWKQVPFVNEDNLTKSSSKATNIFQLFSLFDIEFTNNNAVYLSESDKKEAAKQVLSNICIKSLVTTIKDSPNVIVSNVALQSDNDILRYIERHKTSLKNVLVSGPETISLSSGYNLLYKAHAVMYDANFTDKKRIVVIPKNSKKPLGKLICDNKNVYFNSYDNVLSVFNVTIDHTLDSEKTSFPITKSERDGYEEKIKTLTIERAQLKKQLLNLQSESEKRPEGSKKKIGTASSLFDKDYAEPDLRFLNVIPRREKDS